ncbi:MAG: anti-sigma factor [Pyrinomonadaceae bacterium]
MNKRLLSVLGSVALAFASAAVASAQETKTTTTTTTQTTKTIQNPDGTYTIVQYPADKEVTVNLTPGATLTGSRGLARVLRHGDLTTINLDLASLPADTSNFNVYAVDPMGKFTLLGPVTVANGAVTQTFTTPLDKFMLVMSPESDLSALDNNTPILFRSAVPEGLAVIPFARTGDEHVHAVGETVSGTTTAVNTPAGTVVTTTPAYNVPMLGIPTFKRGVDSQVKVNLAGEMTGSRVNFRVLPRKDGPTSIVARFHELKDAPAGKRYVLWAVSPDNKFTKLGQIINTTHRNEAEIKSETSLADFGLFITSEDATEGASPTGPVVATIIR